MMKKSTRSRRRRTWALFGAGGLSIALGLLPFACALTGYYSSPAQFGPVVVFVGTYTGAGWNGAWFAQYFDPNDMRGTSLMIRPSIGDMTALPIQRRFREIPWEVIVQTGAQSPGGVPPLACILLPPWMPLAAGTAFIAWGQRRRRQDRQGLCPRCSYDLRGLQRVTCPECGRNLKPAPTPPEQTVASRPDSA